MTPSTKIEGLAANFIRDNILKCPHLEPLISEGDREPSWDGNIKIYNTTDQKKENMLGRISVQVKGQECDSFDEGTISYPVEIADLRNYLNNGGVVFFVVQELPNGDRKAFYETLLPVKIQQYLDKTNDGQITKNITLYPFPVDAPNRMETILANFYIDAHKQASFSNSSLMTLEDIQGNKNIEQISFSTTKYFSAEDNRNDSIAPFLENEVCFYAKVKGSTTPEPIKAGIKSMAFISQTACAVTVGEKAYYPNCTIIRNKQKMLAKWGPGFVMTFPEDGSAPKFQYKYPTFLSQRIHNQEFICAAAVQKEFKIGPVNFPIDELTELLDPQQQKNLEYLQKIQQLLSTMHVAEDLDFTGIKPSDSRNLDMLERSITEGLPVSNITICKDGPTCTDLTIGNITLRIIVSPSRTENGKYDICDFFAPSHWLIFYTPVNSDEHRLIPRAGLLKEEDFLKLSNIDYDYIVKEYEELAPQDCQIYLLANETLNMLLTAYDKKPKEIFLDTASKISQLMLRSETPWFSEAGKLLDVYQIIRRKRKFTAEEEDSLYGIAEKESTMPFDRMCTYLLLGDKKIAKRLYKSLTSEEQVIFNGSPLHRFWK